MSVAVVSVGAKTAVGLNARQTGFMVRAGYPGMSEAPLANGEGEPIAMAFVQSVDGALVGAERLAVLARAPFEEAVSPIRDLAAEVHIVIDEDLEDEPFAIRLLEATVKRVMPASSVEVKAGGAAGAGQMLATAVRALESRRADVVVIGGVHSDYDPRAIAALEQSGRLFSRENLDSRIPGEAAAFFALMRAGDDARRQGLAALARIVGTGSGIERARLDNDVPAHEALGLTAAIRQATEPLADGQTVGWILSDLTFEMWRQLEWQSVLMRVQEVLGNPYYADAPAQRIGYLGAAAVPLFVAVAAAGWQYGYAPAPLMVAMAGGDLGARTALVLGQVSEV